MIVYIMTNTQNDDNESLSSHCSAMIGVCAFGRLLLLANVTYYYTSIKKNDSSGLNLYSIDRL
jgi:hypothetical protein